MVCETFSNLGSGPLGGLDWKKLSRVQRAELVEVPISVKALAGAGYWISWMRSLTSIETLSADEVAGMVKVVGRNWTVFPKRVSQVTGSYIL